MRQIKKWTISLFLLIVLFLGNKSTIFAANNCTKEAATQLAKILYTEVGASLNTDPALDAFGKFTTAAVIVNNASGKSGSTMYEKLLNLNDGNYSGYSSYKNKDFSSYVYPGYQSKLLYIAECVLSGTYTIPKNMIFQASESIVTRYGHVWEKVPVNTGTGSTVYFGYSGSTISQTDVFGNTLPSTSPSYYKSLASNLMNVDYSSINVNTVCNGNVDTSGITGSEDDSESGESYKKPKKHIERKKWSAHDLGEVCKNPGALKAIYILKMVMNVLKIVAPAILIIVSGISLFKVIMDDGDIKTSVKNFITKFVIAVFIYFVPMLITLVINFTANLTNSSVDIDECLNNATPEKIKEYENNLKKNT